MRDPEPKGYFRILTLGHLKTWSLFIGVYIEVQGFGVWGEGSVPNLTLPLKS